MTLAATLSAIRTLVLDAPKLPQSQTERAELLRAVFPTLTVNEIEDLSKIEPERLEIYTDSVFSGEGHIIRNNFPMSWEVLSEIWEELFGAPLKARPLAQRLHKVHPWVSTRTENLVENFVLFVHQDLGIADSRKRLLDQLVDFELASFLARRTVDGEYSAKQSLDREALTRLSIGDLMDTRCYLPPTLSIARFDFDMIAIDAHFGVEGELPTNPELQTTWIATARDKFSRVTSTSLGEHVFSFLTKQHDNNSFPVSELAASYVNELSPGLSEEHMFEKFLLFFVALLDAGVIILPRE